MISYSSVILLEAFSIFSFISSVIFSISETRTDARPGLKTKAILSVAKSVFRVLSVFAISSFVLNRSVPILSSLRISLLLGWLSL